MSTLADRTDLPSKISLCAASLICLAGILIHPVVPLWWIAWATVGALLGYTRGATEAGLWVGLLLGPCGLLWIVFWTDHRPKSPKPRPKEPGFCKTCALDGEPDMEMGEEIWRCPQCGIPLR